MVDTLIVGSGVVAAAISQRLLERNPSASILILEAGDRIKTKDFALWDQYLITGRLPYEVCRDLDYPNRDVPGENSSVGTTTIPLLGARLFVYGGSTMHWGGWSFRLKPEDFRLKSLAQEGGDWPIDYDAFEPYYSKAEHYLAVSGDSSDGTVPRKGEYPFRPFPFTLQDQPLIGALQKLTTHASPPVSDKHNGGWRRRWISGRQVQPNSNWVRLYHAAIGVCWNPYSDLRYCGAQPRRRP